MSGPIDPEPTAGLEAQAREVLLESMSWARHYHLRHSGSYDETVAAMLAFRAEADTQHAEVVARAVAEEREACSSLLRSRARKLRTAQGRVAAQWHKLDADMVAGELDRQAAAIRGRT